MSISRANTTHLNDPNFWLKNQRFQEDMDSIDIPSFNLSSIAFSILSIFSNHNLQRVIDMNKQFQLNYGTFISIY